MHRLSTARIIEAVLHDEDRILPVSSLLDGQDGISDICLLLLLDRRGVRSVLTPPITDNEAAALPGSADAVRNVARTPSD